MSVVLTLLYAPADRPDVVRKALAGDADVVIVDLEDAIAPAAKEHARAMLPELVDLAARSGRSPSAVQVRVNGPDTPWGMDDLAAVAPLPQSIGVRMPKVTGPGDVFTAAEGGRPVHCLLESAAGVENAYEIASSEGVATIGLGEADLRSDLGLPLDSDALGWCRQRIVVAARAAGLPAPAMSVHPNVSDLDGLALSTREGRAYGFLGRAAVHPRQLPVIEAAFAPTAGEVERAHRIVDAVSSASEGGSGAVVLADGRFLDIAMVDQARRVLELDARLRESPEVRTR